MTAPTHPNLFSSPPLLPCTHTFPLCPNPLTHRQTFLMKTSVWLVRLTSISSRKMASTSRQLCHISRTSTLRQRRCVTFYDHSGYLKDDTLNVVNIPPPPPPPNYIHTLAQISIHTLRDWLPLFNLPVWPFFSKLPF